MDSQGLQAIFLEFVKPIKALQRTEDRQAEMMCEVLKEFLRCKATHLVEQAKGRAILYSYGSDGTPLLVWSTIKSTDGRSTVTRKARRGEELLIEVAFLKAVAPDGEILLAFLARDPVPLSEGKKTWHMFPPMCSFFPLVQKLGHKGIVVSHYVFDRLVQSSLQRKARQRHGLYHLQSSGSEGGVAGGLPDLLDWVASTACGNHDGQNALKWGLRLLGLDQTATHKKLWVTIASLRNSFDLIQGFIHPFVVTNLSLQPRVADYHMLYSFWVDLGVEVETAESLAELGLLWVNGQLVVDRAMVETPGLVARIEHCIKAVLKLKQFSDSRWVTMGASSRQLVAGKHLGLDQLVAMIRKDKDTSDFYIHGYTEFAPDAQVYSTVAGMVCNIPDALLLELLEDSRLAKRVDAVKAVVEEEVVWLQRVPTWTWDRLAALVEGVNGQTLRSRSLVVSQAILAFLKYRIWDEVESMPWLLCRGDIAQNIADLRDGPDASDHTTIKIQKLARLGWRMSVLVDGVERLGDVPWSTSAHEQGHGSAACIHKVHPGYSTRILTARAFLHICRCLYSRPPVESIMKRTEAALARLDRKQPSKVHGKQMFLKDLQGVMAQRGTVTAASSMAAMQQHSKLFLRLPRDRQREYQRQAELHADAREVEHELEIEHLEQQRALVKARHAQEMETTAGQIRASNCRFTTSDWEQLHTMWSDTDRWGANKVEAMRLKSMTAPVPPQDHVKRALEDVVLIEKVEQKQPAWCNVVSKHRDLFYNSVLLVTTALGEEAFRFLFAMQNPHVSGFLRLTRSATALPPDYPGLKAVLSGQWEFTFEVHWGRVVLGKDMPVASTAAVVVVPWTVLRGEFMVSDADGIPLDDFVAGADSLPGTKDPAASSSGPKTSTSTADLPSGHGWMRKYANPGSAGSGGDPGDEDAGSAQPSARVSEMEVDEVHAAFAELEEQREELRQGQVIYAGADFKSNVLGGAWTKLNKAKAGDRVKVWAASKEAKEFSTQFFGERETSFSIRLYSMRGCNSCALLWSQRMQHFFDIYVSMGSGRYLFTADDLESAPTHVELPDPLDDMPQDHPAVHRLLQIIAMEPASS